MTNYARDEFDRVPEASSRQGVHRAVSGAVPPAFVADPERGDRRPCRRPGRVPPAAATWVSRPPLARRQPRRRRRRRRRRQRLLSRRRPRRCRRPAPRTPLRRPPPRSIALRHALQRPSSRVGCGQNPTRFGLQRTLTSGLAGRVGATVQADGWALGQVANWQRRAPAAVGDLLLGCGAQGQRRGARGPAEHHRRSWKAQSSRRPLRWCSAPDSSRRFRLRLNNYCLRFAAAGLRPGRPQWIE